MIIRSSFIIILLISIVTNSCVKCDLGIEDIIFIIHSQENSYHKSLANSLKKDLLKQSKQLFSKPANILQTHENFNDVQAWELKPLMPYLKDLNCSWILLLEDRTKIHLKILFEELEKYDPAEEIWIGHSLHDSEATIIHHFAFIENPTFLKYPNLASGVAISSMLIKSSLKNSYENPPKHSDFAIDPSHEFALYIWNNGKGPMLKNNELFCTKYEEKCATYVSTFKQCSKNLPSDSSVYFGVKTCEKFLENRVEIVKNTWGKYPENIKYFGDVSILHETQSVIRLHVPDVSDGHCEKTTAILRYFKTTLSTNNNIKWIVITDDDTILSVSRLLKLLSCYNSNEMIALGERYRFNSQDGYGGYDYITGGGGMVFSRPLAEKLAKYCICPSPDTPDDMYIGICLSNYGVKVVHSPFFHQARPMDYSPDLINRNEAISFHKHWMMDPIQVYTEWFEKDDELWMKNKEDSMKIKHDEL